MKHRLHHADDASLTIKLSYVKKLERQMNTSHKGGFWHRESCVDFILLCQQVLAFDKDSGKFG